MLIVAIFNCHIDCYYAECRGAIWNGLHQANMIAFCMWSFCIVKGIIFCPGSGGNPGPFLYHKLPPSTVAPLMA